MLANRSIRKSVNRHDLVLSLDANTVAAALPYDQLIDALDEAFRGDVEVPLRAHHAVPVPGGADATLLMMPAWRSGAVLGVKLATVFPDNARHSLPAVHASYFLMNAQTGEPLAVLDGTELTLRRTAAASALASVYLSRDDASRLLMIGTGNLAPHLVRAHATVRPIDTVMVWGRRSEAATALVAALSGEKFAVEKVDDLDAAIAAADIVSAATLAMEPLIKGNLLVAGQHVDLVGAFKPDMSEADTDAIRRADVYVDTRAGALAEAGDLVKAIEKGVFNAGDVRGELCELTRREVSGRTDSSAITLFKSVGTALEDLAAAELAMRNAAD